MVLPPSSSSRHSRDRPDLRFDVGTANHNRIRTEAGIFLTSSGVVTMLDVVRNVVVASILGPYLTGLCTTVLVVPQVARYFYVGLIEALPVWLPQHRKKGASGQADSVKSKVWTVTLLIASIGAVVVVVGGIIVAESNSEVAVYLLAAGVLVLFDQAKQFVTTSYLADDETRKASWLTFWFALLVTVCSITAVHYLQGYGFWIGLLIPTFLIAIYGLRDQFRRHKLRLTRTTVTELSDMLPLSAVMLMASLAYTPFVLLSRLFLASSVGVYEVGLFLLASLAIGKVTVVPTAIAKVMLPQLSWAHGNEVDKGNIFDLFIKSQFYTFGLSTVVSLLGLLLLPSLVAWLLPAYSPGVPAAMIVIAAGIPYCLICNATNVLLATRQRRQYLKVVGTALALQVVLFVFLWGTRQVSAYSVSACLFIVFSCYAFFANWYAVRYCRDLSAAGGALGPR